MANRDGSILERAEDLMSRKLRFLVIVNTTVSAMSVTARWLEKMKSLTKLEKLRLQGCDRVDDEAIKILVSFPGLKEIDLKGSAVTEKGIAILRAAKPKARIYYGPWEAKAANFRNN